MIPDGFDRDVGNPNLDNLKSRLNDPVKQVMDAQVQQNQQVFDRLADAVEALAAKLGENPKQDLDSSKKYAEESIKMANRPKQPKNSEVKSKNDLLFKSMEDHTRLIYNASQGHGTFWVGINKITSSAAKSIVSELQKLGGPFSNTAASQAIQKDQQNMAVKAHHSTLVAMQKISSGGGGGGGGINGNDNSPSDDDYDPNVSKLTKTLAFTTGALATLSSQLSKGVGISPGSIFDNFISDPNVFAMKMAKQIHLTEGFNSENKSIESAYKDVYGLSKSTGAKAGELQALVLRNLQRGMKLEDRQGNLIDGKSRSRSDQRQNKADSFNRMKHLSAAALHAASMVGMSVEGTNDLFMDWNMHLGMSALQLQQISQHVKQVSRHTGISGERMEATLRTVDALNKSLKASGNLTAEATANILSTTASAEKHGAGEQMTPILKALSGTSPFLSSDEDMVAMLSRWSNGDNNLSAQVRGGTILKDKGAMEKLFANGEADIQGFIAGYLQNFNKEISSLGYDLENIDLTNLSKFNQDAQNLGLEMMKSEDAGTAAWGEELMSAMGMLDHTMRKGITKELGGVGEIEQFFRGVKELTPTIEEQLLNYDQDIAKLGKGYGNTDEAKRIKALKLETSTDMYGQIFNKLAENAKETGGVTPLAIENTKRSLVGTLGENLTKDTLGDLGKASVDYINLLTQKADNAGFKDGLDGLLKEQGLTRDQLIFDLQKGNENAILSLNSIANRIETQESANSDPVSKINQAIVDWNASLQEFIAQLRPDSTLAYIAAASMGIAKELAVTGGGMALSQWAMSKFSRGKAGPGGPGNWGPGGPRVPGSPGSSGKSPSARKGGGARDPISSKRPSIRTGPTTGRTGPISPPAPKGGIGKTVKGGGKLALLGLGIDYMTDGKLLGLFGGNNEPNTQELNDAGISKVFVVNWGDFGELASKTPVPQNENNLGDMAFTGMLLYNQASHAAELAKDLGYAKPLSDAAAKTKDVGSKIKTSIEKPLKELGNKLDDVSNNLKSSASQKAANVKNTITESKTAQALGNAKNAVASKSSQVVSSVKNAVTESKTAQALGNAKNAVVSKSSQALSNVKNTITESKTAQALGNAKNAVASKSSQVVSNVKNAVTESKTAQALGNAKNAVAGSKAVKTAASVARKIPIMEGILSGGYGYLAAEEYERTKTGGVISGLTTGSLASGTEDKFVSGLISSSMGLQKGSNADEAVGALGASGRGAAVGAVAGPIGAAAGAIVGAGAEISKVLIDSGKAVSEMKSQMQSFDSGLANTHKEVLNSANNINSPTERLKEIETLIASKKISLSGIERNIKSDTKARSEKTNWFGINPAANALNASIESNQRQKSVYEQSLKELQKEAGELKVQSSIEKNLTFLDKFINRNDQLGEAARGHIDSIQNMKSDDFNSVLNASQFAVSDIKDVMQVTIADEWAKTSDQLSKSLEKDLTKGGFLADNANSILELAQNKPKTFEEMEIAETKINEMLAKQDAFKVEGLKADSLGEGKLAESASSLLELYNTKSTLKDAMNNSNDGNLSAQYNDALMQTQAQIDSTTAEYDILKNNAELDKAYRNDTLSSLRQIELNTTGLTTGLNSVSDSIGASTPGGLESISNLFEANIPGLKMPQDSSQFLDFSARMPDLGTGILVSNDVRAKQDNDEDAQKTEGSSNPDSLNYTDDIRDVNQNVYGPAYNFEDIFAKVKEKIERKGEASSNTMDYRESLLDLKPEFGPANNLARVAEQMEKRVFEKSIEKRGQTSTNLIDYSDSMKGQVNAIYSYGNDIEARVAQRKYGEIPNGSSSDMMELNEINDYLVSKQANYLETMIEELRMIRKNTEIPKSVSNLSLPHQGQTNVSKRHINSIAREITNANWDLTFSDASPGSVTSEGRV